MLLYSFKRFRLTDKVFTGDNTLIMVGREGDSSKEFPSGNTG
jgi:hypothetical protein